MANLAPRPRQEYIRVIAEWNGRVIGSSGTVGPDLHINELLLSFWRHAETHYRRSDGRPTSELGNDRVVIKTVRQMCGHTRAVDFGPLALKTLRQQWTQVPRSPVHLTIGLF